MAVSFRVILRSMPVREVLRWRGRNDHPNPRRAGGLMDRDHGRGPRNAQSETGLTLSLYAGSPVSSIKTTMQSSGFGASVSDCSSEVNQARGGGRGEFELTRPYGPASFQDWCLKPLGHPSNAVTSSTYRYIICERLGNRIGALPGVPHDRRSRPAQARLASRRGRDGAAPALSCRSCRPNAPFAELVRRSKSSVAEAHCAERSGNRWVNG